MRKAGFFILGCLFISSCTPRITTSISRPLEPVHYKQEILMFGLNVAQPPHATEIGIVKIRDSGFTVNCGWDAVIEDAKMEARNAGGNAIKITRHIPPSIWGKP
jgi:hypothetical protein